MGNTFPCTSQKPLDQRQHEFRVAAQTGDVNAMQSLAQAADLDINAAEVRRGVQTPSK